MNHHLTPAVLAMPYKTRLLTILLLSLVAVPLHAQDHLIPATGYFSSYSYASEYYPRVQATLLKGLSNNPVLRIVVLPSFSQEYVLSLEQQARTYTLRCVKSRTSIWEALQQKKPLPLTDSHAATLSPEAARAVAEAFNAALDQTHYPSPKTRRVVMDGVNYHFVSFRGGLGLREGTAHSPTRGSNPALLVGLTEQLQQFALQSSERPKESELIRVAQSISAKLAAPTTN